MCVLPGTASVLLVVLYFKGEFGEGISARKAVPGHLLNTQLDGTVVLCVSSP